MHHGEGCWWYACIKVQCLHEIASPMLILLLSTTKQGQRLFLHIHHQGRDSIPATRGKDCCLTSIRHRVASRLAYVPAFQSPRNSATARNHARGRLSRRPLCADTQAFQRKGLSAGISTANNALSPLTWLGASQIQPSPLLFYPLEANQIRP